MSTAAGEPHAGVPAGTGECVRVGEWTITALSDGTFRLDGGSMWGVVPANLWRTMTPPAEDNTILMALRPFLLERGDVRCVVEVGVGDRWSDKLRAIYHLDRTSTLAGSLAELGLAPEDVTHVIASHCHWDHVGAQVVETPDGLAPLFPNARHFAPALEIENARRAEGARKGSYRPEDVLPIEDAGLLEAYDGDVELLPGVRAHVLGGHSDGVAVITVGEDEPGDTAIFWADVVPTAHHVQPPYIMAYDIDVVRSFDVRKQWLERVADEGWIGLYYHDPDIAFGRLRREGRRFVHVPVPSEPRR